MKKTTTKPAIKTPNRIKPKKAPKHPQERPLTNALMGRVKSIIEGSEKRITIASLSKDIGRGYSEVSEWVGGWRSAPNGETTLKLLDWTIRHENGTAKGK